MRDGKAGRSGAAKRWPATAAAGNDAILDESLRILSDYVDFLTPKNAASRLGAL